MKKVKHCYGCYAYKNGHTYYGDYCGLGYETERDKNFMLTPKKCCNKPKTLKEFFDRLINEDSK